MISLFILGVLGMIASSIGLVIGIRMIRSNSKKKETKTLADGANLSPEETAILQKLIKKQQTKSIVETKPKKEKKPEQPISLEVVSVGKTVSTHIAKRLTFKEAQDGFEMPIGDVTIKVTSKDFFMKQPSYNPKNALLDKIRGIKHHFITFINETTHAPYVSNLPKVSAESLFIVKESTTLSKALKEMFSEKFEGKKLLFIGIIVVVAIVVAVVVYTKIQSGGFSF